MTTLHTPQALSNFNTTSFSDELFRKMVDAGYTVEAIERLDAQIAYRKAYNQRPDVKAKRAAYNAKRNEAMKSLRAIVKAGQ